jgi:hypothetical protein
VERFGGEERPVEASIDYRRKRGMLEEINRTVRDVKKEEDEMDRIRRHDQEDESGPVDLPVGPGPGFLPSGPSPTGPSGAGAAPPPAAPPRAP